ncbi:hypothetical protein D3C86_1964970 [compost metagenome]
MRQPQAEAQQQHQAGLAEALEQAAECQFEVPGFQLAAPVEVQTEAAGDVDRLPDHQHQGVAGVAQVLQP